MTAKLHGCEEGEMKRYKLELEILVRDPDVIIKAGREMHTRSSDWDEAVEYRGGNELFAAMGPLFASGFPVSGPVAEAVEFYSGEINEVEGG